jgi:hypothetical protein
MTECADTANLDRYPKPCLRHNSDADQLIGMGPGDQSPMVTAALMTPSR